MRQIREILRLKWECGLTHRAIARACSVGVGTVSEYAQRAAAKGLSWPLPDDLDDRQLESLVFPGASPVTGPRPLPEMSHIHQEFRRAGVTLLLLWMEYRQAHPEGYGYSQFCERYRRWARTLKPSMRQVHRAGEKVFVDFSGKRPQIVDRLTGEETDVELFVGVLGASSYTYAEACATQDLPCWTSVHVGMVESFGGSAAIWVPDNLKSGVTSPCRYEPLINRTYEEMAEHYGAAVIPARVRKPQDKAKAESGVQVVQRWILARLRNRIFFSLAELNQAIRELLVDLNNRPMRDLGASRRELFEKLDRPALKPLPTKRYEMGEWKNCKVNIDYHIDVARNYYSVPYQLLGQYVDARFTISTVEIFHKSRRVASHQRLSGRGRFATRKEHMPSSHRAHVEWNASRMIRWAENTGPSVALLVGHILENRPHPEQGFRTCLGIIGLAKKYSESRLEAACQRAVHLGSYSYRTVKNILSTEADRRPLPSEQEIRPPVPCHENIRGGNYYSERRPHA